MSRDTLLMLAAPAALVALLVWLPAVRTIEQPIADAQVRLVARIAPPAPLAEPGFTVVAIDAQSLRVHPDWPWPRARIATAVDRMTAAGARAIAIDLDLSAQRDPADDRELAAALRRSGRVVLAALSQREQVSRSVAKPSGDDQEGSGDSWLELANLPPPELRRAAAAVASIQLPLDADGAVRAARRESEIAATIYPSLAESLLRTAGAELPPEEFARAGATFPIDYRRANEPLAVVSIADVIADQADPELFRDRIVLIGATAAELQDLWPTPVAASVPGVLLHAFSARTLAARAAGESTLDGPHPIARGLWLALWLVLGALLRRVPGAWRMPAALASMVALIGAALAALALRGALLEVVAPCAGLALHYALALERVRLALGRRVEQQESSLALLANVGDASARGEPGERSLDICLALLGDVVDASGVALLRARSDGSLDGRRLEWRRSANREVGCGETAERVLRADQMQVFEREAPAPAEGVAVYVPLRAGDQPVGVLVVERAGRELDAAHRRTIATVATQLSLTAENLRLVEGLRETFDGAIAAIATAVEARDGYTELHCRRLAVFSSLLAERLGLPSREVEAIRLGALLHDVGKIGIRDEILLKPGHFTPEERREMQRHTAIGDGIVGPIPGIHPLTRACVRHHHERIDGEGYPDRLTGDAIPLGARIVTVVDVWDALSTDRPYKRALAQEPVRALLEKGRGTAYDPIVLDAFIRLLRDEGEELLDLVARSTAEGPLGR